MFVIVLGQLVSILIESSSSHSKEVGLYIEIFKMRCGIPKAYVLNKTMYKMHVSFIRSFIKNVRVWDPTARF